MDIIILEKQWQKIDKNSEHKAIRLSHECKCDLYLGFDNNLKRRLILSLLNEPKLNINDDIKEYICIQYYDLSNHLIITLIEDRFSDVFNSFIISVFFKVKSISSAVQVSNEITNTYYEWSEFFTEKGSNQLRLNDLLGIIGELFILNREIINAKAISVNDVLKSWTGPYDKGHDFVFDLFDLEIKTIEASKTEISISSQYQLDCLTGKKLELKVLKTEINGKEGNSLSEFIEIIRNSIIAKLGDLSIFLKALQKHGISMQNMKDYDNYKFKINEEITFDCTPEDFPKLTRSNIPKEISSISYNLKIDLLHKFLIDKISY